MNFDPGLFSDTRVKRAFEFWDGLREGRELPARTDIDPQDIVQILKYVILVDVLRDPTDFRFRLAGTDVVRRFGEELTGHRLSEVDVDGKYRQIFDEYELTVTRRQPSVFTEAFTRKDGKYVQYTRLLCPLSADGVRVDMLFGVQVSSLESFTPAETGIHKI
jgi:hypothetical protein